MNLNYPRGSTASAGSSGPAGTCKKNNVTCETYNYGWNAAAYAFAQASQNGASAPIWWLDIETGNSWSGTASLNDSVIEGAVDYIETHGASAGIYSTGAQWTTIAGSTFVPGKVAGPGGNSLTVSTVTANWLAGGSGAGLAAQCTSDSPLYTGGKVTLIQFPLNGLDGDYAC